MTARAVVMGLVLGLFISVATYFNDWVIGQSQLIGNYLPISVFGIALVVLLVVGPALGALRLGRITGREVLVMTALALASCGWPGSNFYRGFVTVSALPAHWLKTSPGWQANHVMSYVPGASAELGQGHVQDWDRLTSDVVAGAGHPETVGGRLWESVGSDGQRLFTAAHRDPRSISGMSADLTRALDVALQQDTLYSAEAFAGVTLPRRAQELVNRTDLAPHEVVEKNRWLLVGAYPGVILPPPRGSGTLVAEGRADPFVVDTLLQGRSRNNRLGLLELPWGAWMPTMLLWGSLALLLGFCSLCLALIVHPQWSKRELLPYPIVRFVEEAAATRTGRALPEIARNRLFWIALGVVVAFHLVNGLHSWFPDIPEIPRRFEFGPLQTIFPNAFRVSGQYGWFAPTIYLSAVAFSFFMSRSVAFSLGVAHLLFFALGSVLIVNGIQIDSAMTGRSNMLRMGAYLAVALMIVYTGRRYYLDVVKSALGAKRSEETPVYATWAARGLGIAGIAATLMLCSAGLHWALAVSFLVLTLIIFVVMTRIVTETGAFFAMTSWMPVGAVLAVIGFDAIGPTGFIVLAVASVMLTIDTRELLMPFLANGLRMTDREGAAPPSRLAPWVIVMMLGGFVVAGAVTLYLQYNQSVVPVGNSHGTHTLPRVAFDAFVQYASQSAAEGRIAAATGATGWARWALVRPDSGALLWLAFGFALALGTAAARLRLPWWPLHPVAFLVWDTYALIVFGPSFLLGWLIKSAVVGTAGARGYHAVKPLMVGIIAAELLSGLGWMVVGAVYFFATGKTPPTYWVFAP